MSRLKDWLRFTLISFETLYVVSVIAAFTTMPSFFVATGRRLSGELKIVDIIYGIPLSCLIFSYPLMSKIIFPDETLKKELKKWPHFIGLVDRVYFSLAIMGGCSICAIATRFIGLAIPDAIRGFLTVLLCGLAIIPVPSLVAASVKIKIITDEFSGPARS